MGEIIINLTGISNSIASLQALSADFPKNKIDTGVVQGLGSTYQALVSLCEELNASADALKQLIDRTVLTLQSVKENASQGDNTAAGNWN